MVTSADELFLGAIEHAAFDRVLGADLSPTDRIKMVADMCRLNTLTAIKRAGSGHIGSSFSSLEIVATLYCEVMNIRSVGIDSPDRDIYFSSKGHDAPGLYAMLHALGIIEEDALMNLRRIDGVPGHPDILTPGIEAGTGSLGQGISKGKGFAIAKRLKGHGGRIFVMTGDGELQEGQNYEALQAAVAQGVTNLTVLVDHNKVQSDRLVSETQDLGDLEAKFRAFGWQVARCDGHDPAALLDILHTFATIEDKPKIVICDTLKGAGVSFMEHPTALPTNGGDYAYHSGAPSDADYRRASEELVTRIHGSMAAQGMEPTVVKRVAPAPAAPWKPSSDNVAWAFGRTLVELGEANKNLFVMDGDLAVDTQTRPFATAFPDRYIEAGIAEQDMLSTAGGLALQGFLPVVNSFGVFLAARANEQIYTNACERTKIVHVCHYAGVLPAAPGASHQSLRDIGLFSSLPEITIVQPCNEAESAMLTRYCVEEVDHSTMIRLQIGPSPRAVALPADYRLARGRGVTLTEGGDGVLLAYGPVMVAQALEAAEILADKGLRIQVVNMPWLNVVDEAWLAETVQPHKAVFVLDDHAPRGGLGDFIGAELARHKLLEGGRRFFAFAVEGYPACGTPAEALAAHRLDGPSLAARISGKLNDLS